MGAASRARVASAYLSCARVCVCVARARARESGGGLIGRWRHDGGSEKRGHVRSLSNGHPTHPQPRHSPVSPTYLPPPPRSSSSPRFPLLFRHHPPAASLHLILPSPFISAPPQRHYYHYHHHHAPNPYTHRAKL